MFGTGTACVVTPINRILYVDKVCVILYVQANHNYRYIYAQDIEIPVMDDGAAIKLHDELQDIQVWFVNVFFIFCVMASPLCSMGAHPLTNGLS